jgi:hypothetical protein
MKASTPLKAMLAQTDAEETAVSFTPFCTPDAELSSEKS